METSLRDSRFPLRSFTNYPRFAIYIIATFGKGLFLLLFAFSCAFACQSSSTSEQLSACHMTVPPTLDGMLSHGEWEGAAKTALSYQVQPGDNTSPTEETVAMIGFDSEFLYIAFRAQDSDQRGVRARVTRRDDVFNDDYVTIYLDTFNDRRRAYAFSFNPYGIQADGIFTESSLVNRFDAERDLTWDGIIQSHGEVTPDGYIIEAAIPFSSIRFSKGEWGIHLQRWIARKAERVSWRPLPRTSSGFLIQMGSLDGVRPASDGWNLDLIPTVVASNDAALNTEGELADSNNAEPGFTAFWGMTPNLAFSGTLNPDFSQVESDVPQIEVNQRFPLYYPEKRPFFLEGADIFRNVSRGSFQLVDTRQIIDPDFGMKLTGKIGRNAIGILTSSDNAQGFQVEPGEPGYAENALFNIVRYQRDLLKDSYVGMYLTDTRFAGSSNTVAAADGRIRLSKTNDIGFQAIWSRTSGENDSQQGQAYHFRFSHEGKPWRVLYYANQIDPEYVASAGFTRRTGFHSHVTNLGYEIAPENPSWYVTIRPFVVAKYLRTSEGYLDESFTDPGVDILLPRGISFYLYYSFDVANFTGADRYYQFARGYVTVESFKKFIIDANYWIGENVNFDPENPVVGDALNYEFALTFKPDSRLNTEFRILSSRLTEKGSGNELFKQNIYRNRTLFQINKNHAIRSILEYDSYSSQFSISELYAFTPFPGTAFYAGYGDLLVDDYQYEGHPPQPGMTRIQRTFFVKFSYNWRL